MTPYTRQPWPIVKLQHVKVMRFSKKNYNLELSYFREGFSKIINQKLNPTKEYFVDEGYLVAFDSNLEVKTISRGFKELLQSGEG